MLHISTAGVYCASFHIRTCIGAGKGRNVKVLISTVSEFVPMSRISGATYSGEPQIVRNWLSSVKYLAFMSTFVNLYASQNHCDTPCKPKISNFYLGLRRQVG